MDDNSDDMPRSSSTERKSDYTTTADTIGTQLPGPQTVRVIQEIYQDYNDIGYRQALAELDGALAKCTRHIVIEPVRLGDETVRWIQVGNFLHKSTVITGTLTTTAVALSCNSWYVWAPLATSTALTFGAYTICWQSDPCCKYQVEKDQETLATLDIGSVCSQSVVVLTQRDDTRRRWLHSGVTAVAAAAVVYAAWHNYNQQ